MKKKSASSSTGGRKLQISLGTVIIVGAVAFFARGLIRNTVLPNAVKLVYGHSIKKTYQDEMTKLQDPPALLGYQNTELDELNCSRTLAQGFKTQVYCGYNRHYYSAIKDRTHDKATLVANATKLQKLLKDNGWEGEYANEGQPHSSLVKLVTSVSNGIDYLPDAAYSKTVGNIKCMFDSNTAFSKPNPPAFSTQISCSRSINVLGEPSWN